MYLTRVSPVITIQDIPDHMYRISANTLTIRHLMALKELIRAPDEILKLAMLETLRIIDNNSHIL